MTAADAPLLVPTIGPHFSERILQLAGSQLGKDAEAMKASSLPGRAERAAEFEHGLAALVAAASQIRRPPIGTAVGTVADQADGVTTAYAAEVLGVSERQVTNLLRSGVNLQGTQISGRWVIDRESLAMELSRRKSLGSAC